MEQLTKYKEHSQLRIQSKKPLSSLTSLETISLDQFTELVLETVEFLFEEGFQVLSITTIHDRLRILGVKHIVRRAFYDSNDMDHRAIVSRILVLKKHGVFPYDICKRGKRIYIMVPIKSNDKLQNEKT
ncbi:MAG: hypothetical protein WC444_05700 [Candidatus Paceibacterota bacterium]